MADRGEAPFEVGAQAHPLDGRRPVPRDREHLLPGHRELDWSPERLRRHDRHDHVRARRALGAEPSADVGRDHADLIGLETERLGHGVLDVDHALVGVVERDAAIPPDRERGVRLHRVVVLGRRLVGAVDRHLGARERLVEVTVGGVGRVVRVDLVGLVEIGMVASEQHVMRFGRVLDPDEALALSGRLVAVGQDRGDDLPAVGDAVRLQDRELAI